MTLNDWEREVNSVENVTSVTLLIRECSRAAAHFESIRKHLDTADLLGRCALALAAQEVQMRSLASRVRDGE
jgi:hypothetical protein